MKRNRVQLLLILGLLLLMAVACSGPEDGGEANALVPEPTPVNTEIVLTVTPQDNTPSPTTGVTLVPTETQTPAPITPCYSEDLPYAYAESPAMVGWRYFAQQTNLSSQVVYFPDTCSESEIQGNLEYLFYTDQEADRTTILLLSETQLGVMGSMYSHLNTNEFWAMGPEDYPMVLSTDGYINPNILIYRIDRLYGEGHEGDEILGLMMGLAEHEYIHTVQARNNPDLAELIWGDPIYQAVIERYANLDNNSGSYYFQATYSYLSLIQMLDGLSEMGELDTRVKSVLGEMEISLEDYLAVELVNYDTHLRGLLVSVAGEKYLTHLEKKPVNALLLISRLGLGDVASFTLVRTVYDRYVDDYNLWYYGSSEEQYLPESFDLLFGP
ncbi:MAG: hypothetical protein HPY85_05710 [Anaerolineae bacterium]|nr:hypothetical protein [Anaerolineae bacterium]